MKQLLIKAVMIGVLFQVLSICSCVDNCEQQYFRVLDIFLENAQRDNSTYLKVEEVPDDFTIAYNNYSVALINGVEYYTNFFNFKNPFRNELLACSTTPQSGEQITNMLIWSNSDFVKADGTVIPAGNYLNSLFLIDYRDNKGVSIAEFLQGEENYTFETVVFLTLNEEPLSKQAHRFFVRYELDSGNSFASSTERVNIEP